jgi:hypothetical protein
MPVELSMSVLVVEDSRTMGQIVRNLLTLMGFSVRLKMIFFDLKLLRADA